MTDPGAEGAHEVHEHDGDDTIRVERVRRSAPAGDPSPDATVDDVESTTSPPRHLVDTDTRPSRRGERALLPDAAPGDDAPADARPREDEDQPGRRAYSPDHEALRARYGARPAAPVMAQHAGLPARMAQSAVDGEAVDRSVRGKARRRVAWVGTWITVAVVCGGALLAILLVSFLH